MKRILTILTVITVHSLCAEQYVMQEVGALTHAKMPLAIGIVGKNKELKKVSQIIKHDLEFTDQFAVSLKKISHVESKDDVTHWYKQGYSLVVFIEGEGDKYTWRLYDTLDARMIKGKTIYSQDTASLRQRGHYLADELWPELTGNQGYFSTKIVYGKQVCQRGRNCKRYIYVRDITDSDGLSEEVLVASPTINIVPRWNRDPQHPLVLFSQYRSTNIALVAVDMKGKKKVVSNFDGVNMQVAYSPQGNEVVYCLSRNPNNKFASHLTSQLYYYCNDSANKECLKRLTHNPGNNFAPHWGPDQTLFFASDATKSGNPNICWMNLKDQTTQWLTENVYATSPNYCPANNKLAYARIVEKRMQLWLYDIASREHKQLTFDPTEKDDCTWSPCGNFLSYSVEINGRSRIAIYNMHTREQKFLTSEDEDCSYPAWSPYSV